MFSLTGTGYICRGGNFQKCFCRPFQVRLSLNGKKLRLRRKFIPFRGEPLSKRACCIKKETGGDGSYLPLVKMAENLPSASIPAKWKRLCPNNCYLSGLSITKIICKTSCSSHTSFLAENKTIVVRLLCYGVLYCIKFIKECSNDSR